VANTFGHELDLDRRGGVLQEIGDILNNAFDVRLGLDRREDAFQQTRDLFSDLFNDIKDVFDTDK